MNNKIVKVIDEHNIDRVANVMFALELEGSEYVVYWIQRDEESNNVFVSKVLKNIDGTYNMLNIDDDDKKKEIAETVKMLISNSVTDQNDKLTGVSISLSNGKTVKFVNVSFNKEQQINVTKTYITTVKKEVTKVAETYYDVVIEEAKVEAVLPAAPVAPEPVSAVFPELTPSATTQVQSTPTVVESITSAPIPSSVQDMVQQPIVQTVATPEVSQTVVATQPVVQDIGFVTQSVQPQEQLLVNNSVNTIQQTPVVAEPQIVAPVPNTVQNISPAAQNVQAQEQLLVSNPVNAVPQNLVNQESNTVGLINNPQVQVTTPQVIPPVLEPAAVPMDVQQPQSLVFNASKETNLNAALGEVANSAAIPVTNIDSVREFGVESPVSQQPPVTPMVQPEVQSNPKLLTKKAGFANSKFFMVVAIAFFLASCVFLGYEVYNYFQLVK